MLVRWGSHSKCAGLLFDQITGNISGNLIKVGVVKLSGRWGSFASMARARGFLMLRTLALNQRHGLLVVVDRKGMHGAGQRAIVKGGDFCASLSEGDDLLLKEVF